mgnify:CR=1 FL=1
MEDDVFVSDNWCNIIWNNRLNEIIDTDELIVFCKVSIGFSIGEKQLVHRHEQAILCRYAANYWVSSMNMPGFL